MLTKARHLALSSMIHYVWRARNSSFFEERQLDIERILRSVQIHVYRSLGVYSDLRQGGVYPVFSFALLPVIRS